MRKIFSVITVLAFVLSQTTSSFAASSTWLNTGNTSASWVNSNNWGGAGVPGGLGTTTNSDVATFNTAVGSNGYGASGTPVLVDATRNIGGITFDTSSVGAYTISGSSLALSSGGTIQTTSTVANIENINGPLVLEGNSGTYTFTSGSSIAGDTLNFGNGITAGGSTGTTALTINGSNTGTNTISGNIGNGGSGAILSVTKSGAGTWVLSGINSYTGGTNLSAGTLVASSTSALGGASSALAISGGTLDLATDTSVTAYNTTITGSATIDSDKATSASAGITQTLGTLSIGANTLTVAEGGNVGSGTAGLTFGATTLTASGATFTADAGTLLTLGSVSGAGDNFTVNGAGNTDITGIIGTVGGSVTYSGTGTLNLSGTNTYTGGTNLSSGTLVASNTSALGGSSSALAISGGTLDLATDTSTTAYNTTITGSATIDSDKATGASAGITQTLGTLSIGANTLTVAAGSNVGSGTAGLTFGATTLTASGAIFTPEAGTLLTLGSVGGGGDNFTVNGAGNADITGIIGTGAGSVTYSGTGTLNLSGTNTYTGGTNLSSGTLVASNTSALGGSSSALAISGGTLDLATDTSTTAYNTTITGSATIDSDKATSASAGITQTLGTLSIGANTLTVAEGGNVGSGTAGLTFGATTLTASGATFTADAGTLLTLGSVSGAGYNFTVNGAGNTDITGIIGTVGGSVTKAGAGTLDLSGNNTYTGGTAVNAGTLELGSSGAMGSSGTISFGGGTLEYSSSNTTDYSSRFSTAASQAYDINTNGQNVTFATGLTGSGSSTFTKTGTGTLTLDGDSTFTGLATISAGTVVAGNANALGAGSVTNDAALTLDTTSLNVGGTYTQAAGSSLNLTANSSSSYGSISAPSASVLANNTVNVTVGGYIPNGAVLTIIDPVSGVTGVAPGTVNSTSSFVSFTDSITGNDLILTANHASGGFGSVGGNSNAAAAGSVLDNETNPSSDLTTILNTLESSSASQVRAALNTLVPVVDGGVIENTNSSLNNFVGASISRVGDVLASSGNSNATGVSAGDESKVNGLWAKQFGSYLDQGTRAGIEGYTAWNTGTTVGLDRMVSDNFTLGASVAYSYGEVSDDANNANSNINSAQGTIYAGYQSPDLPYYIDGAGYFSENWYSGQRDITVNTINRIADASYTGQQEGIYVEGGYKIDLSHNLVFAPITSLQWTHLNLSNYSETNAGSVDLNVNKQGYDTLESGLGASISTEEKYGWGSLTPEFHAKWLYDFIDDNMSVTSSFSGGGAAFTSTGARPAKDGVDIGGKLTFDLDNDISLITGVDTDIRDTFFGVSGTVTVRYKF